MGSTTNTLLVLPHWHLDHVARLCILCSNHVSHFAVMEKLPTHFLTPLRLCSHQQQVPGCCVRVWSSGSSLLRSDQIQPWKQEPGPQSPLCQLKLYISHKKVKIKHIRTLECIIINLKQNLTWEKFDFVDRHQFKIKQPSCSLYVSLCMFAHVWRVYVTVAAGVLVLHNKFSIHSCMLL